MPGIGRREQKKLQTMEDIVTVGASLFSDQGYDRTRIEDIAEAADVSPGTVYNYFGTKRAILAAVAAVGIEDAVANAAASLDLSTGDPVDAMVPVLDAYMGHVGGIGKDLLKEMLRSGFDPAASEMLADLVSLDEQVIQQIAFALNQMQEVGMIASSTDIEQASLLVYSIVGMATMWYVSVPETSIETAMEMISSQLALAFAGIAVR